MLIQAPGLRTIPSRIKGGAARNVIGFSYNFGNDTPAAQNLGGYAFTGSVYELDISSVKSPSTSNLPSFKALQFMQTYNNGGGTDPYLVTDGALIIFIPETGQLMQFGVQPGIIGATATSVSCTSGVVSTVSNMPTKIQFGKEINVSSNALFGKLRATLFDFEIAPYITQGYSNSL